MRWSYFADELGYFRKCVLMMTIFNPFITFKWPVSCCLLRFPRYFLRIFWGLFCRGKYKSFVWKSVSPQVKIDFVWDIKPMTYLILSYGTIEKVFGGVLGSNLKSWHVRKSQILQFCLQQLTWRPQPGEGNGLGSTGAFCSWGGR